MIVGGGFAGLNAAKTLGNKKDIDVLLIDRRNYHLFQPLLYQVAMAGLSPAEIAAPIRTLLSKFKNIRVLLGNVENIDLKDRKVFSDVGCFEYDYLLLGCGAKHSYFGNEVWEPLAPGLKTIEQATEIRRRVLMAFERAESEADPQKRKALLTFVVVGGGPTGVELAGAIGEISRFTLSRDFKDIRSSQSRIVLIEAGNRILAGFDEKLSKRATRDLEKLGVQVWTNSRVSSITKEGVCVGDEFLSASTALWAAGVKPSSLNQKLGVSLDSGEKVEVSSDLSVPGHRRVFVMGDQAAAKSIEGQPLPGLAPVAMQAGRHVGRCVLNDLSGKERKDFKYVDKGQMATIGRTKAVLQVGRFKATGYLAWLSWLFVHVYYLIGFKNRLFVLFQWAWSYISYSRGARLILHKEWRSYLNRESK